MSLMSRLTINTIAGLLLVAFSAGARAQTLTISFDGSVLNCIDMSLNQSLDFSVTATGTQSGSSTLLAVNLGGDLGNFSFSVPTSEIQALSSALSSSGGNLSFSFGPDPLGPPGCDIQGTITISLGGNFVGPDAPGNLATTGALVDSFVRSALPAISGRVNAALTGGGSGMMRIGDMLTVSGMAAGNGTKLGAWAGYSYSDSKNDFATTSFSSDRHTMMFGIDTMPGDNWLIGVSATLEHSDVDTRFNSGKQNVTAISVTPYAGFLINEWLTADVAFGIGSVQTDQYRTAGGAQITSDVDSLRVFGSANATGTWAFDSLLASVRAGALYATQGDEAFIESNGTRIGDTRSSVGRFLLGGELAYSAGTWEPYVGATFEYDFTRTKARFAPGVAAPKNDDTDVLFATGIRYFGSNDVSGSLEYSTVLGRRNYDEDTFTANVRWQF